MNLTDWIAKEEALMEKAKSRGRPGRLKGEKWRHIPSSWTEEQRRAHWAGLSKARAEKQRIAVDLGRNHFPVALKMLKKAVEALGWIENNGAQATGYHVQNVANEAIAALEAMTGGSDEEA